MILTFQIILIVMILIGFIGVMGEKKDNNLRNNLAGICVVGIIAFVLTITLL